MKKQEKVRPYMYIGDKRHIERQREGKETFADALKRILEWNAKTRQLLVQWQNFDGTLENIDGIIGEVLAE